MGTGPAGLAGAAGLGGVAAAGVPGVAGFATAGAAAAGFSAAGFSAAGGVAGGGDAGLSAEAELPAAGGIGFAVVGLASPSGDGGTCGLLSSAIGSFGLAAETLSIEALSKCARPSLLTAC